MDFMSKYDALTTWLAKQDRTVTLSFADIERIIGDSLPASAHTHRPWWGNQVSNTGSRQCRAWLDAGWEIEAVDQDAKIVTFRKR